MKVIKEIIVAGKTIFQSIKVSSGNHSVSRKKKRKVTLEKVQMNNDRLAAKELGLKLNANFEPGDIHLVLTYKEAPGQAEAKADREKFIRTLRKDYKSRGQELKYVAVTEYKHQRIHHHIVVNNGGCESLSKMWEKGYVHSTELDSTGNYMELAEYLIKETTKTFREEGSVYRRRYSSSNNLKKPIVKRMEVSASEIWAEPEPIKGYYIPKNSIRRFEHPITGLEHTEFIMVALGEPRKYKAWPKGKVVSGREKYKINYWEEQESLLSLFDFEEAKFW